MDDLDDLLAQADEVIAHPEEHLFQPVLMLRIVVALAREVRALRTPVGGG